jgi:preprotein translocase subunit SecD
MLVYERWKYVLAALICVIGALYSLPNLYPQDSAVQVSGNRGTVIDEAVREKTQGALETARIEFKKVELGKDRVLVRLVDAEKQLAAADAVGKSLGQDYTVALNLAPTVPKWLTTIGANPMTLGLDLQGGVHFLMEVDARASMDKLYERYVEDLRTYLREKKIGYRSVTRSPQGLVIALRTGADRDTAFGELSREMPALQLTDGVPTGDAFPLLARLSEQATRDENAKAIEQNIATLRNRINQLQVAEPIVQQQGATRIVVQMPGIQDTALAKKILGATATLEYRAVDESVSAFEAASGGRVPPTSRLYYRRELGFDGKPIPVLLRKQLIVSGDQMVHAAATRDQDSGTPSVDVTLNASGGRRMEQFTQDNVGKPMAVVYIERIPETKTVDGKEVRTARVREEVISVATIKGVFGRRFQTTGLDSPQAASELALLLRSGSLAVPVDIVEERVIGPSLGKDNIEAGSKAVVYSFLFVLAFFLVYYKTFGVVTNLALLINLLLVVAVMSLFGATLTLPGLAGIALTVGMSVDANVLINERVREELRSGNSPLASIGAGFEKASGTIFDANVTALLAGIALWAFGTGPIQGFAVTLCVGILTSMYTAVSVARGIATLFYGGRKVARLSI